LKKENVCVEDMLKALSDNKSLILFDTIAISDNGGSSNQISIRKLGLTTRQYYSRLAKLTETGLIKRQNGRYSLTLLGKMIHDVYTMTCRILSYHWKLKALESIQASAPGCASLPIEEFSKVVDTLIDDPKIKNLVAKAIAPPEPLTNSEKYSRLRKEEKVQAINVLAKMA
jgi:hypothetical protein